MRSVLNFEDSPYKQEDIRKLLQNMDFDVTQVDNLEEGIKMVKLRKEAGYEFDLIVSDFYFPAVRYGTERPSGNSVISLIREMDVSTPVIICSSALYKEVEGMAGFIQYGDVFWEEDLQQMIEELFDEQYKK